MQIELAIVLVLAGFVLLMYSADILVDNASELGSQLGISALLIGIIVVGFGTSAPELFVSAMASLNGKGNLALGNALGSNITEQNTARRDIPLVFISGVLAVLLVLDGVLSTINGLVLLIVLISYLVWAAKKQTPPTEESQPNDTADEPKQSKTTLILCLWIVGSIIALMLGSKILLA